MLQRWLAAFSLTVILTAVLVNARQPYLMDFASFWAAAKLAVSGQAVQAYDIAAHHAAQMSALPIDKQLPFAYPPPYLLAVAPFGLLPYAVASPLWVALTLSLYAWAAYRLMPGQTGWALAMPAVVICAITGQNGALTAALFLGAMAALDTRPVLAGFLAGCLVIKPQLAVLLPLAFMAGAEKRAFAAAALSVGLLCTVSTLIFGFGVWTGFFGQSVFMGSIATDNLVGWEKMASVYAALRLAGAPNAAAWVAHVAVALAAAASVWRSWRLTDDALSRAAVLAPASLLVSPYLYLYDQVWLAASVAWLARERANPWGLVAVLALPVFAVLQFGSDQAILNPAPLTTLLLLAWIVIRLPSAPPPARPDRHDPQTAQNSR